MADFAADFAIDFAVQTATQFANLVDSEIKRVKTYCYEYW